MPQDGHSRAGFGEMTWGVGKLVWAVGAIILAISLIELAGGDFASGIGLLTVFVVLSVVLQSSNPILEK